MKVHKEIYDLIKWQSGGGFDSWVTYDIETARENAIKAIRNYRELKKEKEERDKTLSVFRDFLSTLEIIE